jgi:hypothetical protein
MEVLSRADALPTIYVAYEPIENYLEALELAGCRLPPGHLIRPVDALTCTLLTRFCPAPLTLVDLAAEASLGLSTVLCRSQARARNVITTSRGDGPLESWRPVLESFHSTLDAKEFVPTGPAGDRDQIAEVLARAPRGQMAALVLFSALQETPEGMVRQVVRWLDQVPDSVVVLLGLGETGMCERLTSLTTSFGSHSPYRLVLVRELGVGFHESGMGLIFTRTHPFMDNVLFRLRQFFTGNHSFLSLARTASDAAIRAAAREQELAEVRRIQGTISFQFARRLNLAGTMMAPQGSLRRWLLRKTFRALQVWKADGLGGVVSRTARKVGLAPPGSPNQAA